MQTEAVLENERLEVERILASGIFNRAPNLAHLLKYVCNKYFDGAAEQIKEYNIAVEALGRPAEFDQKRDSIVRVEAHRLRKRLREYYERDGADHAIRIEIPPGQYTPKFVSNRLAAAAADLDETRAVRTETPGDLVIAVPPRLVTASVPQPRLKTNRKWVLSAVAVLCVGVGAFLAFRAVRQRPEDRPATAAAIPPGDEVRILCGVANASYVDAFERTWQADRYYTGGEIAQSPRNQLILGTRDQQIYRSRREGAFRYDIPLKPGVYELRLHFAETMYGENNAAGGAETTRLFELRVNGEPFLTFFDVIADAGSSTADIKVFKDISPAPDGKLHLDFRPNTNASFVNAIEVLPGVRGRIRPLRIVARDRGLKDNEGRYWAPDWYARGGQIIARSDSNVQSRDPELYRSERFGNLTYSIPVAQSGKYAVNLYFAENWFGPGNPGGGGAGNRTFDVLLNGVMLRKNLDIFHEAGGADRALVLSEHGIEANHQGKIVISLVPGRNYACINALEVIDESPEPPNER